MSSSNTEAGPDDRRRRWLSILAKAPGPRVEALKHTLGPLPPWTFLRRPEVGLVMVHGRISGKGAPFCAGEMTVTRAAVRLETGEVGFGYVGGRDSRHAETIAAIDALGQRPEWRDKLESELVAPLAREAETRHRETAARAAATKVEFFTVAREGTP